MFELRLGLRLFLRRLYGIHSVAKVRSKLWYLVLVVPQGEATAVAAAELARDLGAGVLLLTRPPENSLPGWLRSQHRCA